MRSRLNKEPCQLCSTLRNLMVLQQQNVNFLADSTDCFGWDACGQCQNGWRQIHSFCGTVQLVEWDSNFPFHDKNLQRSGRVAGLKRLITFTRTKGNHSQSGENNLQLLKSHLKAHLGWIHYPGRTLQKSQHFNEQSSTWSVKMVHKSRYTFLFSHLRWKRPEMFSWSGINVFYRLLKGWPVKGWPTFSGQRDCGTPA